MSYQLYKTASLGSSRAGLPTVGYQLFNADGTASGARVASGIADLAGGQYGAVVTFPDNFTGRIQWDSGELTPVYASEEINAPAAVVDSPGIITLLTRLTEQRAENLDNLGGFTDDDRAALMAIKGRAELIQTNHITISNNVSKAGNLLVLRRGTTWKIIFTDLGSLAGRTNLYFTLKEFPGSQADSKALCQISEQGGLLYLNGAAAQNAAEGSLLVTDEEAGNVEITVKASSSKDVLHDVKNLRYGLKAIFSDRVDEPVTGPAQVVADITRATS